MVGVTALFLASKYEELYPPEVNDFVYITDDTYSKKQILEMEQYMMKKLDFHLGKPLTIHFLRRFSKAAKGEDINHILAKYLLELASVDHNLAHYNPSEIACAALYLSLQLFPINGTPKNKWTATLQFYTRMSEEQVRPIAVELATVLQSASIPGAKLKAVFVKYSSSKFDKIAMQPILGHGSKVLEAFISA